MVANDFLDRLLQEAKEKVQMSKTASQSDSFPAVARILLKEAMAKESMAYSPGARDLANSMCNVQWRMADPTPRITQIKNDIEAMFQDYKKMVIGNRQYATETGLKLVVPPDQKQGDEEVPDDASIYFRFTYFRDIFPINCEDFMQRAESLTDVFGKMFEGFDSFIAAIKQNKIPLQSYFNNSVYKSTAGGGATEDETKEFLLRDKMNFQNGLTLPNGMKIPSNFYGDINPDEKLVVTAVRGAHDDRIYSNDEVENISVPGHLLRAISNKVSAGYMVDEQALKAEIDQKKQEAINRIPKNNPTKYQQKVKTTTYFWDKKYSDIIKAWKQGYTPKPIDEIKAQYEEREVVAQEELAKRYSGGRGLKSAERKRPKHAFSPNYVAFTDDTKTMARPLFDVIFTKRTYFPSEVKLDDLRMILKNLTVIDPSAMQSTPAARGRGRPKKVRPASRDHFVVNEVTVTHRPNGLDSSPLSVKEDPTGERRMPVLPTLRTLPDDRRTLAYDRESGNLGRYQLVNNWTLPTHSKKDQQGVGGLKQILDQWGDKCSRWLNSIVSGNPVELINRSGIEDPSIAQAAMDVIRVSVGQSGLSSRTNAETLLTMLSKYPTFDSFQQNHLKKSLPSEIRTVSKLRDLTQSGLEPDLEIFPELRSAIDQIQANPENAFGVVESLVGGPQSQGWFTELEAALTPLRQQYDEVKKSQAQLLRSDPTKNPNFSASDPAAQSLLRNNFAGQRNSMKQRENAIKAQATQIEEEYGQRVMNLMLVLYENLIDQNWDNLTRCLGKCAEMNGLTSKLRPCYKSDTGDTAYAPSIQLAEDTVTGMQTPEDFNLLRQYGYPVAKMMDFVHALMTVSCEEVVNNRTDGKQEKFYARGYSSSSGKGGGGQVILSVYYAFRPEWSKLTGVDPKLSQRIKDEMRARHTLVGPAQPTRGQMAPMTQHFREENALQLPDNAEQIGVMRVMKDVRYFIGLRGGTKGGGFRRGMIKSVTPAIVPEWEEDFEKALDLFKRNYGDALDSIDSIIEPINVHLRQIDASLKNSFDKIRQELEQEMQQPIGATWQDEETGAEEVIDSSLAEGEELEATQEAEDSIPYMKAEDITLEEEYPEDNTDYDENGEPIYEETPVDQYGQVPQPPIEEEQPPIEEPTFEEENQSIPAPDLPTAPILKQEQPQILKNKKEPKRLVNDRIEASSLADRLIKIANAFDTNGLTSLADKVDLLIHNLRQKDVI